MGYKYQRGQIFGKRLKVPKLIKSKVYNKMLSFNEYIKYELEDKIPTSCLREQDRVIVDKFGILKSKDLDWDLINNKYFYCDQEINIRDLLLSLDSNINDINKVVYSKIIDNFRPSDYTDGMKKMYPNKVFTSSKDLEHKERIFNDGKVNLINLIKNSDFYIEKDWTYCLNHDSDNVNNIDDKTCKDFVRNYKDIFNIIYDKIDIYKFIDKLYDPCYTKEQKENYISTKLNNILVKARNSKNDEKPLVLKESDYKTIFKHVSMEDTIKDIDPKDYKKIMYEINSLKKDFFDKCTISYTNLLNYDVLRFVSEYGLENIVNFDIENNYFFTKNNCFNLKNFYNMYIHYAIQDFFDTSSKNIIDGDINLGRYYTLNEFYESIKRMILNGPTDWSYKNEAPTIKSIDGVFRDKYDYLYISKYAPSKLIDLFYKKEITLRLILDNPTYHNYLNEKDLYYCCEEKEIKIVSKYDTISDNLYRFLDEKLGIKNVFKFVLEYGEVLDSIYDYLNSSDNTLYSLNFTKTDNVDKIINKISGLLRRLIVEKNIIYPKNIPNSFRENNPNLFISQSAPLDVIENFYNRNIDRKTMDRYKTYLKKVDLNLLYKYNPINYLDNGKYENINIVDCVINVCKDKAYDIMLDYGKYLELLPSDYINNISYSEKIDEDDFLNSIDIQILKAINNGLFKYDDNISKHFRKNYPDLFLKDVISDELKNKFYNRKFNINDFIDGDFLDIFNKTNVAYSLDLEYYWLINLFSDNKDMKDANKKRIKVLIEYSYISDKLLQKEFINYLENNKDLSIENISNVSNLLKRISSSTSRDIFNYRKELFNLIVDSKSQDVDITLIENLFNNNDLPIINKIINCFEILHPNFEGFKIKESDTISPVLKSKQNRSRKYIVYADLIKIIFGSNNKSINEFINHLEISCDYYNSIKDGDLKYDELDSDDKNELILLSSYLKCIYNNTIKGRNNNYELKEDIINNIDELVNLLDFSDNLCDRIIDLLFGYAGIKSISDIRSFINERIIYADTKNRKISLNDCDLKKGDLVKNIGDINILGNILENGLISKEYLGLDLNYTDTPLDVDFYMVDSGKNINSMINKVKKYGNIYVVLKNNERFILTRDTKEIDFENDMSKMELFNIERNYYGIRTGIPSSEIDYFIVSEYDDRIGLEIALNGFYIPVYNKDGKILFSPYDFDRLRSMMGGLYGEYQFSDNLKFSGIDNYIDKINNNDEITDKYENYLLERFNEALNNVGYTLTETYNSDINYIEIIDIGSTSRGTNYIDEFNYDFVMRLDKSILNDRRKLNELKKSILISLNEIENEGIIKKDYFGLKNVKVIDNGLIDFSINFIEKQDRLSNSTDMVLRNRLINVYDSNPDKYDYVIANILYAKEYLNNNDVYKNGINGIGVENWILAYGGSFKDALNSFIDYSNNRTLEEFKKVYSIWDYGENISSLKNLDYIHDNIINNLNEKSYKKLIKIFKELNEKKF